MVIYGLWEGFWLPIRFEMDWISNDQRIYLKHAQQYIL
uniref:Uncharacterized protein n=1 Tax=Pyramimonas orientalis virus TaxID=455367 RepID=A0A7M3UPB2_POV01|nr:hypothetical protein HWQ62_00460 [Pyramimonas orientalis virus]